MVIDGCNTATQLDITSPKMLVAMNGQGPALGQAGAYAIGPLRCLAPDRTRPKPCRIKRLVINRLAAPINRNPVAIGQQNATPRSANRLKQAIKRRLGKV
jgi:hypothetical protein